jgi:hypothetical protein
MPKKTKREKMLADRRHSFVQPLEINPSIPAGSSPSSAFQFRATTAKTHAHAHTDTQELRAIQLDITKTIILAVAALAIEFAVYWQFFRN